MPKRIVSVAFARWHTRICENVTPSNEHSMRKSSLRRLSRYHTEWMAAEISVVAQSEKP